MIPGIFIAVVVFTIIIYFYLAMKKMKNAPMAPDSAKIKVLTEQNFNQQTKKGVMLVDYWASWCAPCKMMVPVLNEISESLPANKSVGKVDVEKFPALASKFSIRGIPTMILFKDGKEINRFVGMKTKDFLLKEMGKVN
jgi:thioredoxin 1